MVPISVLPFTLSLLLLFLSSLPLQSRASLFSHSILSRQIDGGGQGDPGIYPGGSTNGADLGWRTLPSVTGANIDTSTFTVNNGSAALTTYITADFDPSKIKRVVVEFPGENRDAWNQYLYVDLALDRAVQGGDVKREEVVIVAPMPFTIIDYGAYPSDLTQTPTTDAMIWQDQSWGDGTEVVFPRNSTSSMFDALDSIINHFSNPDDFPNLVTIVIGGFSLGAQLVNRYASFRDPNASQDSKLKYWICSPASFLYFNDKRPEKVKKSCKGYNDYKYGLDGVLPIYYDKNTTSKSTLTKSQTSDLIEGYLNKRIGYAVGLRDRISGDPRCEADAQGKSHVIKVQNWVEEALPSFAGLGNGQLPANSTIDYVKYVRHEDFRMIQSDAGVQRLFLDDYSSPSSAAAAPPSNGDVNGSPKNSTDSNSVDSPVDPSGKSDSSSGSTLHNVPAMDLLGVTAFALFGIIHSL